jgi:hypothetical protein
MTEKHVDIAMGWYTPETWRELRAHPEARIEKTYSEYLRCCDRFIAGCPAQGLRVVKVPIDIPLMIEWCHAHGYEIDSGGRAVFAGVLLGAQDAGDDIMSMEFRDATRTVQ